MSQKVNENLQNQPAAWIQKLKDESWQAELLVSTIAIFGSLQFFKVVDWFTIIAIDRLIPDQYMIGYAIVFVGLVAVSILSTMFIIHFLLRAYWVGLVGLNSVFPDYSLEDSAYSEIYTSKILSFLPKLTKTIKDVDELASVIFSAAFYMLLLYSYFVVVITILLGIYNYFEPYVSPYVSIPLGLIAVIFFFVILISIVANIKALKDNRAVQLAFFYATKYTSLIFVGPLYKYMMQISMTFATNYKKKKSLIGLTLIFVLIGVIITMVKFSNGKIPYLVNQEFFYDSTKAYHGYYKSNSKSDEFLLSPQITSDVIESSALRVFIPVYSFERRFYSEICGDIDEALTKGEKKAWYLDCYSTYHTIHLNNKEIRTDFMKYEISETGQFGIITYLDISEGNPGKNMLRVSKTPKNEKEWEIPFFYVPSK